MYITYTSTRHATTSLRYVSFPPKLYKRNKGTWQKTIWPNKGWRTCQYNILKWPFFLWSKQNKEKEKHLGWALERHIPLHGKETRLFSNEKGICHDFCHTCLNITIMETIEINLFVDQDILGNSEKETYSNIFEESNQQSSSISFHVYCKVTCVSYMISHLSFLNVSSR